MATYCSLRMTWELFYWRSTSVTPCSSPTPQVCRFPFYFIPSLSTLYSVPLLSIVTLNVRISQVVHSVSLFTPARLLQPVWNMNNKQRSVSIGVLSTLGIRPLHPQGFIQDFELGGGGTGWYQDDKLFNTCEISGGGRENFRPPLYGTLHPPSLLVRVWYHVAFFPHAPWISFLLYCKPWRTTRWGAGGGGGAGIR